LLSLACFYLNGDMRETQGAPCGSSLGQHNSEVAISGTNTQSIMYKQPAQAMKWNKRGLGFEHVASVSAE
jgi:hypothetical protein